jgi:hypothetical protein
MKNIHQKLRDFELERLIFMAGETPTPDTAEAPEAPAAPETDDVTDEDAATLDKAEETAKKTTEETKEKAEEEAGKAGRDVDELISEEAKEDTEEAPKPLDLNDMIENLYANRNLRMQVMGLLKMDKETSQEDFAKNIKASEVGEAIQSFVNNPENRELSEADTKKALAKEIGKAYGIEKVKAPDAQEVEMLKRFKIGKKPIEEVLGSETLLLLSMRYDFRVNPKNEKEIQANSPRGSDTWKKVDETVIHTYLPKELQETYKKTKEEGGEVTMEDFQREAAEALRNAETAKEFQDMLAGNLPEGAEKMSMMEWIASLMQLYALMKDGDYESLMDGWQDIKEGIPVSEGIENAREEYRKVVDTAGLDKLLALHGNPKGAEEFGSGDTRIRYRGQLKVVVQERMQSMLGTGVNISEMKTPKEGGSATIFATKGRRHFEINISAGGIQTINITEIGIAEDGKEEAIDGSGEVEFTGLAGGGSLGEKFTEFFNKPKPEPQPAPPTTPGATTEDSSANTGTTESAPTTTPGTTPESDQQ